MKISFDFTYFPCYFTMFIEAVSKIEKWFEVKDGSGS
jgi:hypothetical protein